MYALMSLLSVGISAGADAVVKKAGVLRRRQTVSTADPLTGAATGGPREVSGHAVAGSDGPITAPLSGEPCVWYAVTVLEHYHAWRPGPLGPGKVVRHVKAAEQISGPLHVVGDTATVRVDTQGADLDLGEPVFSEFEDAPDGELATRLAALLGTPLRARHRRRTLGFVIEERTIAADDPLYIVGQARADLGDLVIVKPAMRPLIVSRTSPVPVSGGKD